MVDSIRELDTEIRARLKWTEGDSIRFLTFAEPDDKQIQLRERTWITPRKDFKRLNEFLVNDLGATRQEKDGLQVWTVPKRREAEAQPRPEIKEENLTTQEPKPAKPITVELSQLQYGVFSPRKANRKWIDHLKEAIQNEGAEAFPLPKVKQHPYNETVKPPMPEPVYQLIDGEHFCKALQELDLKTVKVEVCPVTDEQADFQAMRLNQIHGKPLEPIEEARHLKKMMDKYGYSQEQIGEKFQRSQSWVSQRLAMLEIPEEHVTTGVVTSAKAEKIATLPEEDRGDVAQKVAKEELSLDKTKDVVEAIKEAPEKKEHILTKIGVPIKYHCGFPGCKFDTYDPTWYEGVPVCPHHSEQIQKDPTLVEKLKEKPSPAPKVEEKAWEPTMPKPTWPERKQMMHPKVSKMEEAVSLALTEKGVAFEQQREFCVRSTKPDFYFPHQNLAVYLDGEEAHKKRVDRDNFLRGLLTKRYGVRVLGLTYRDNTQKSRDEILQKVLEALEK